MADYESPRPFRRERNLSNRNFAKRNSNRRRPSTDSHCSMDTKFPATSNDDETNNTNEDDTFAATINVTTNSITNPSTATVTAMSYSHKSVSLDAEKTSVTNYKSILKMRSLDQPSNSPIVDDERSSEVHNPITPDTPDPALLGFSQKRSMFENLQADEGMLFKTSKFKSKSTLSLLTSERRFTTRPSESPSPTSSSSTSGSYLVNAQLVLPPSMGNENSTILANRHSSFQASIDEERSEDEVDSSKTEEIDNVEIGKVVNDGEDFGEANDSFDDEPEGEEFIAPVMAVNESFLTPVFQHSLSHGAKKKKCLKDNSEKNEEVQQQQKEQEEETGKDEQTKTKSKDFPRNFRSRPLTEIGGTQTLRVRGEVRFHSQYKPKPDEPEDEEQIEMRDKGYGCIQPILEELIKTEETYVENLWTGINNYGNIFERKDLPMGLMGKKYVLFGNVEQIAEFHRDEFLPMLLRNRRDLKRLFDEFQQFIEQNCFYGYVLFTMNKQRSLKLCDTYKNYFKLLQTELDDRLGINSFLVQPIQRMARYPLLLTQFIQTLFKNRDFVLKPVIESCCRLEKRLRNLLITTNESEVINDIVCLNEANEFNTFYQGKFRKVSEFQVYDHTLKRSYRSKVFIFDKCIIYTEMKGKQLIFHGRYPCEHIGITAKTKSFTLYYQQRKQQECDFMADPLQIEQWLELIKEMIVSYAEEERRKLKELHSREYGGDHMHRKPANLSLFRDSNRFSSDSGIGNIWVVPKPEHEEAISNRTTWYAVT